jgi:hypothetical protein
MNCAISEPFLTLHFQARPSYGTFRKKPGAASVLDVGSLELQRRGHADASDYRFGYHFIDFCPVF